jgi:hypothetical protein
MQVRPGAAASGLVAVLVALGCAGSGSGKQTESKVTVPSAAPTVSAAPTASAATSSAKPAAKQSVLPDRFAMLGEQCTPDDAGAHSMISCNGNRVAGVLVPVDTVDGVPPPSAEIIHSSPGDSSPPQRQLTVAVEGERLWYRLVTCGICRRVMGWSFVGDLPLLTDEQLRTNQARLGIPPSTPPLRTADDWRRYYRSLPSDGGAAGTTPTSKPYSAPPGVPGECMNAPGFKPLPPQCQNLK